MKINFSKLALILIILSEISVIYFLTVSNLNKSNLLYAGEIEKNYINLENDKIPEELPTYNIDFIKRTANKTYSKELIPNFEQFYDGYVVRLNMSYIKINSDGFRDRDFSKEKLDNISRIIMLGDSLTFGMGINVTDSFPKILEKSLNQLNRSVKYAVLNFGVPGFDTREEINFLIDKGLEYKPNLVAVTYNCNDVEDSFEVINLGEKLTEKYTREKGNLTQEDKLKISYEVSKKITEKTRQNFNQSWNVIVHNSFEKLSRISQINNFKVVIIYFPCLYKYPSEKELLNHEAKLFNFSFLDTSNIFDNNERSFLTLRSPDGHLNPTGNTLFAERIKNFILANNLV